jgi:hypothetical protein
MDEYGPEPMDTTEDKLEDFFTAEEIREMMSRAEREETDSGRLASVPAPSRLAQAAAPSRLSQVAAPKNDDTDEEQEEENYMQGRRILKAVRSTRPQILPPPVTPAKTNPIPGRKYVTAVRRSTPKGGGNRRSKSPKSRKSKSPLRRPRQRRSKSPARRA